MGADDADIAVEHGQQSGVERYAIVRQRERYAVRLQGRWKPAHHAWQWR